MYAHEFSFKTWREDPTPIVEAIRGYLESDYDYPAELQAVADDLEKAKAEVFEGVEAGPARDELERALELSLRMNPLTPDHHFYIDQGTNARVRLVLVAIGRKLVAEDRLDDAEDVMYLKLQRAAPSDGRQQLLRRQGAGRRPPRRSRGRRTRCARATGSAPRPRSRSASRTGRCGPSREKLNRPAPPTRARFPGLPRLAPAWSRARRASCCPPSSSARCERDEIVVCRMTSPSWVVLFTKIAGLVTDAGGMASHPAVVSREFGIPAVVGTSDATRRIKTGDRVRVNGSTGRVEIVGDVRTTAPASAL